MNYDNRSLQTAKQRFDYLLSLVNPAKYYTNFRALSEKSDCNIIVALAAVHVLVAVLSRLDALPIAVTALEQYHLGWVLAPEVAR